MKKVKVICNNCGYSEVREKLKNELEIDLVLADFCPKCEDKSSDYYEERHFKEITNNQRDEEAH